jgi:hypothetical protein
LLRLRENHFAALKYKAGYQKFRHEGPNLFRREIGDADNLTPEEVCFGIKFGHLGAGFHYAEITTRLIVPARISTFSKSCQDMGFILKALSEHSGARCVQ